MRRDSFGFCWAAVFFVVFLVVYLVIPPDIYSGLGQSETEVQNQDDVIQVLLQTAYAQYEKKDFDAAIASYKRLIDLIDGKADPKPFEEIKAQTLLAIADCFYQLGENDKAKGAFIDYLRLRPDFTNNPLFAAEELSVIYGEAKADFRRMIAAEAEKGAEKTVPQKPVVRTKADEAGSGKKKRRFPWLIVSGLVVGGMAAVLLLANKEGGPSTGTISVSSTPSGARVLLDGVERGTTSISIAGVSVGRHTIQLIKDGYRDFTTTANVTAGQTVTINATLMKHVITVTKPEAGVSWIKGSSVQIGWVIDASTMAGAFFATSLNIPLERAYGASRRLLSSGQGLQKNGGSTGLLRNDRPRNDGEGLGNAKVGDVGKEQLVGGVIFIGPERSRMSSLNRGAPSAANSGLDRPISGSPPVYTFAVTSVKIDLYKGTNQAETIASNTANDGAHNWIVPASLSNGTDYTVRVSCVSDLSVSGESRPFAIRDQTGNLRIESTPVGARIFLDGTETGKATNSTLPGIAKGQHVLKLMKEGYQEKEGTVSVISGRTSLYRWTLSKHVITVTSPASGAKWYGGEEKEISWAVDAARLDDVAGDLPQGQSEKSRDSIISRISIDLYKSGGRVSSIGKDTANDGSYTWRVPISLESGKDYKIRVFCSDDLRIKGESCRFTIEAGKGRLSVKSEPSGAAVFVDGADSKKKTPCDLSLNVGKRVLELKKERYLTFRKSLTIKRGENPSIKARLELDGFTETFDSADVVNKYFVESHPACWNVKDGVYRFIGSGTNVRSTSYYNPGDFKEFSMQADCKTYDFDVWYGLGFRGNEDFSTFWCFYVSTADGRYEVRRQYGDNEKIYAYGYSSNFQKGPNKTNTLKVESFGTEFSFSINGEEVLLRYPISGIDLQGRVGLVSKTCYKYASFDNLVVEVKDTTGRPGIAK